MNATRDYATYPSTYLTYLHVVHERKFAQMMMSSSFPSFMTSISADNKDGSCTFGHSSYFLFENIFCPFEKSESSLGKTWSFDCRSRFPGVRTPTSSRRRRRGTAIAAASAASGPRTSSTTATTTATSRSAAGDRGGEPATSDK